jgi:hypothetical protein
VAVTEGQPGRRKSAGTVADEVDDGGQFGGHGDTRSGKAGKYSYEGSE